MSSAANSAECSHLPMNKLAAKIKNHFFQIKKKSALLTKVKFTKKGRRYQSFHTKEGLFADCLPNQCKPRFVLFWPYLSFFCIFALRWGVSRRLIALSAQWSSGRVLSVPPRRSLCKELIPGISKNQKTLAQISPRTQTDSGVFNKSSETVTMSRVTLIVGLPPRLISFWIISSQNFSNFL